MITQRTLTAAGLALALVTAFGLAGCEEEGPAEQVGEKIDESVEETGEALEETGDEIEDSTN